MEFLPFRNRLEAGRRLVAALERYRASHPLVLAVPRGAVPMGRVIADGLGGELDLILVRKLGAPGNPELAIGAIDEQGRAYVDRQTAAWTGADEAYLQREAQRQLGVIRERRSRYCGDRPGVALAGRTVIVVDDGLATGATMLAALRAARAEQPARLVCAVPVGAPESLEQVRAIADDVVSLAAPSPFHAVGLYYRDFSQVEDEDVVAALAGPAGAQEARGRRAVDIAIEHDRLPGDLVVPPGPRGLVIFAHGSGSSRLSARNRAVAAALNKSGFATLLFDLLTPGEDQEPTARFDIHLLARRLDAALAYSLGEPDIRDLPKILFGASTGAAAALVLAASRRTGIAAVVSRGGRPDLAGVANLQRVAVPTLLLVGGEDTEVLRLNREAQRCIGPTAEVVVIPGAGHLFEEPGTLDRVADVASRWLLSLLSFERVAADRRASSGPTAPTAA